MYVLLHIFLSFLWIQDERELKRQRRKQSNRESARRSRLRKQVRKRSFIRLSYPVILDHLLATEFNDYYMCMILSQAECDELAQRAEFLKEENASLRSEVSRIRSEYDQLLAENASLKVIVGSGSGSGSGLMSVFGSLPTSA